MATLTAERTMLYCPKCQRKYEEGSQRFCNNDGGRLLPAVNAGVKRQNQSKGVFTNLLAKASSRNERDERLSKNPRFVKDENVALKFEPPKKSQVFKSEQNLKPTIGRAKAKPVAKRAPLKQQDTSTNQKPVGKTTPKQKTKPILTNTKENSVSSKPLSRLIATNDVNLGRAALGDRQKNPHGRPALTRENPELLLGKTIKGRYNIIQRLNQGVTSIAYLAADKIREGKKVVVRVLLEQDASGDFQNKLLTEERVSLSHINHPNIAKVFDSGELPEGKPFIVTDYVENVSVVDYLNKTGVFNSMRTARIIRQSSYALSEIHQNGILHRNLQSKQLLLTVSEAGNETVQVTDFCVSDGKITKNNFKYKSPEQLTGQLPTFASDGYSLAVIAYEMLTNSMPFKGETVKELHKSQKLGLSVEASNLNPDLNPLVDKILTKALSYNPSDRFSKARDFGEAFFNALTTATPWDNEKEAETKPTVKLDLPKQKENISIANNPLGVSNDILSDPMDASGDIHIESKEPLVEIQEIDNVDFQDEEPLEDAKTGSTKKDTLWKKRSPEPTSEGSGLFTFLSIIGLLALIIGAIAVWNYFSGLDEQPSDIALKSKEVSSEAKPAQGVDSNLNKTLNPAEEIESPPPPRNTKTPDGFKYFENAKQNLSPELAKNFRGFSIAYPKNWKLKKFDRNKNKVDDKFLDIAYETKDGDLTENLLISPYKSNGTFSKDTSLFPALVKKSNADISKSLSGNFEVVSKGETTIQNGRWKAYQVNFRTKEAGDINGKKVEIWGRRLWIPVQRPGVENGFIITMIATSLTEGVESADDVGKKGDLAKILETFEPEQNY